MKLGKAKLALTKQAVVGAIAGPLNEGLAWRGVHFGQQEGGIAVACGELESTAKTLAMKGRAAKTPNLAGAHLAEIDALEAQVIHYRRLVLVRIAFGKIVSTLVPCFQRAASWRRVEQIIDDIVAEVQSLLKSLSIDSDRGDNCLATIRGNLRALAGLG
jgi:hypothetical protein